MKEIKPKIKQALKFKNQNKAKMKQNKPKMK